MMTYSEAYFDILRTDGRHSGLVKKKVKIKGKHGEYEATRWVKPALAGAAVLGSGLAAAGTIAYLKSRRGRSGSSAQQANNPDPSNKKTIFGKEQSGSIAKVSPELNKSRYEATGDGKAFKKLLERFKEQDKEEVERAKVAKDRIFSAIDSAIDYASVGVERDYLLKNNFDEYVKNEDDLSRRRDESFNKLDEFNSGDAPGISDAFMDSVKLKNNRFTDDLDHNYEIARDHYIKSLGLNEEAIERRVSEKYPGLPKERQSQIAKDTLSTLRSMGIAEGSSKEIFKIQSLRVKLRADMGKLDGEFDSMFEDLKRRFYEKAHEAFRDASRKTSSQTGTHQSPIDWHTTLGVDKNASASDVKKAFRDLAKKYHPDVNKQEGSEEKMKEIISAYEAWQKQNGRLDSITVYRFN